MGEDLLDGDGVLAVGAELGDVVGDPVLQSQRALAEQQPDGAGDDDLARRVAVEAAALRGAEGGVDHHLAVQGDGQLAGGEGARLDLPSGPGQQVGESVLVDVCSRCSSAPDATVRGRCASW